MTRLCREHPFHSFYQIYCLQADRAPTVSNGSRQSRRSMSQIQSQNASQLERSAAAEDVLAMLHLDDQVGPLIQDMSLLCEAYLEWAKHPITPKKKQYTKSQHNPGPWDIPTQLKIRQVCKKIKTKIPVLTAETRIDPSMRYDNCIWISRYSEKFETAGGINMPKVTVCVGEDDSRHKQLVGAHLLLRILCMRSKLYSV
jgi:serine-protein kinase ATM